MEARLVTTQADLEALCPVLLQLRPQYTKDSLLDQIRKQQDAGFLVACVYENNTPVCVAGFVITEKLAWGKTLYVDDLVTDENSRSQGTGKAMIDWLKQYARDNACSQLHLDSNMHRVDAHRFYDREGFNRASLHFSITNLDD